MSQKIQDIGEQGLLKLIQRFCPADIVGDDGAVLNLIPGYSLVVTTDVLVDGVHFSDTTTSAEDVGWRAAAANLSDLAAMGASPLGITVGLSLPKEVSVSWVEGLYQGLSECLSVYQTPIVGGDVCRSSVITVSITALGQMLPSRVIKRSTAKPEDVIVITGFHGLSRAGLELLLNPEAGQNLGLEARESLIQAHQRPKPRLDTLNTLWQVVGDFSVAGMDSSDGLADAVIQICRCSGVGAQLDSNSIPLHPALCQMVGSEGALEWALYGGEDFELILCFPLHFAERFVNELGEGAAIIGKIIESQGITLADRNCTLSLSEGFQHF